MYKRTCWGCQPGTRHRSICLLIQETHSLEFILWAFILLSKGTFKGRYNPKMRPPEMSITWDSSFRVVHALEPGRIRGELNAVPDP